MASNPVSTGDVVVVTWEDALTDPGMSATTVAIALSLYSPTIRKTTGHLVAQTDKVVLIADTDDRTKQSPEAFGGFTFIPASLVVSIRRPRAARTKKAAVVA